MAVSTNTTADLARAYYASWENGIDTFDEQRLRQILDPDLLFEGPIAGSRRGMEGFLGGLAGFVRALRSFHMLQQFETGDQAAALYDCSLGSSGGTLRFAEFIRTENERITEIRLVYDPAAFRSLVS